MDKAHKEIGRLHSIIERAITDLERFKEETKSNIDKGYISGVISDLKLGVEAKEEDFTSNEAGLYVAKALNKTEDLIKYLQSKK